jgi:hypothetical protein
MKITSVSNDNIQVSKIINQLMDCCKQFNVTVSRVRHLTTDLGLNNLESLFASAGVESLSSSIDPNEVETLLKELVVIQTEAYSNLRQAQRLNSAAKSLVNALSLSIEDSHISALSSMLAKVKSNAKEIPTWVPEAMQLKNIDSPEGQRGITTLKNITNSCWEFLQSINKIVTSLHLTQLPNDWRLPENESELT